MTRGEVWWAQVGDGDRRPVVVLTRDAAIDVLTHVTVAPATTTVRGIPTEVTLDEVDGLPASCVASLDNVRTIRKRDLDERISTLGPERLDAVCRALHLALDC